MNRPDLPELATPLRRFKPYPAYKDSGIEWLGQIPAHWGVKRLKHLAVINSESLPENTDPNFEISYVDIGGVDSLGRIVERERLTFASAPSRARRLVRDGDVIVSTVRTYLRAISPIRNPEPTMVVSTGFAVVRPQQHITTEFAAYAMRAPYFIERVVANSKGVSFPAINEREMAAFELSTPPESEQRVIAAFLDRETAGIDELVEKKVRLIDLLQEERAAIIARVVSKGLDLNATMKPSGVEWLGEIPAHWNTRQGRYLYRVLQLAPQDGDGVITAYRDGQVTLRENRRAEGYTFAIQEIGYQRVRAGDLVIQGMDAFAGAIGVSDSTGKCSPEYLVLDPVEQGTDNRYFAAALRLMAKRGYIFVVCNAVRERAPRFRVPEFRSVVLPLPPSSEQRAIADFLDRETTRIDAMIARIREAIERLKELRTSLISDAVTGKIDVREEVG